jgi:O-antigen/teichoic acid export membrane protein
MKIERRVLGNAASLGVSELIGQIANFGFVIIVARGFGREVFAQYALSMAVGALICTLVSFGSISLLIRSSAQNRSRGFEMLGIILPVQIVLGVGVFALTIAGGIFAKMSSDNLVILGSVVAHHIILRITSVVVTQLKGMERMEIVALISIGRSLITLIIALAVSLTTRNEILAVGSMPVTSILFLLLAIGVVRHFLGSFDLRWDLTAAWKIAVEAIPFFATVVLNATSQRIGLLMLGGLSGNQAVATYASGERTVAASAFLYTMLTGATLPAASRLAPSDRRRHSEIVNRLMRTALLLALPAATLMYLFSDKIIWLLFGNDFISSVPILKVFAAVLAIRALVSVQVLIAVSVGHQRDVLIGRVVSLALLVSVGLPLIREAGPLGLAYSVLAAEIVQAIVLSVLLDRRAIEISLVQSAGATAVGCALTLAFGLYLPIEAFVPRAMLIASCMILALWGSGAVRRHDLRYLVEILKTDRSD